MLRDEYPPFGDADYPFALRIEPGPTIRNRVTVAFRPILVIPHLFVLMFLWFGWCITSLVAWFAIVFTGAYPALLYDYAVGVLRWTTRVEAYALLLTDEYPPFELESPAPMAHAV